MHVVHANQLLTMNVGIYSQFRFSSNYLTKKRTIQHFLILISNSADFPVCGPSYL